MAVGHDPLTLAAPPSKNRAIEAWEDLLFEGSTLASLSRLELRSGALWYYSQAKRDDVNPMAHRLDIDGYPTFIVVTDGTDGEIISEFAIFDANSGDVMAKGVAYDSPQIYWE